MANKFLILPPLLLFMLFTFGCAPKQTATPEEAQTFVTAATPPEASPTPSNAPPPPEDLSPYRQIMKPELARELDEQANKGITRYKIEVTLLPKSLTQSDGPKIQGRMKAQYTNTESVLLNQVYFRLLPNTPGYGGAMKVTGVTVNGEVSPAEIVAQRATLEVPLRHALAPGQSVKIALTYEASIPTTADYGYGMYAWQDNILTLAGFFPVIPVFDADGWHVEVIPQHGDATYTDVALYDVTLTAPADMTIVTSGDILIVTHPTSATQTIHAYGGPMRDFFVAMSPDYQKVSAEVGGITVNSYFVEGYRQAGQFALQVASDALKDFEERFGPYPYRAFDVLAAPMPGALGGVEFPGLIVMAQRYYKTPDDFREFVIAHEVGHQWWYGLVGSDQVNFPWQDEALTQYTALLYFEGKYGPERRQELVNLHFLYPYNQLLETGTDRPVAGPVSDFSETMYGAVVYGKGPLFFEELRDSIGDPLFFAGLRHYANTYRYGIASPEDLLASFGQANKQDVDYLYKRWILE
ncbi:MAG TPA: M1 family metallopeptidase [Chloroflexi bacterium]|nr:M1 family metallopeptidase [Chloroflexota bacterium]